MNQKYRHVFWNDKTLTYKNINGYIHFVSLATSYHIRRTEPQTMRDLVLSIICNEKTHKQNIKGVYEPSFNVVKNDFDIWAMISILQKFKKTVHFMERAYLNPHTYIGRRRLEKEFFTLVIDI